MPDRQFHSLFARVSRRVDLKGCKTPEDVNRRLKQKAREQIYVARDNPLEKLKASNRAAYLKKLIPSFGKRVIDEAISDPQGKIALTLKHGREKAEILSNRLRRGLRINRKRKRR